MKSALKRGIHTRWFKIIAITLLVVFAGIGFFLSAAFLAVKLNMTNDSGVRDLNNRYYQQLSTTARDPGSQDSTAFNSREARLFEHILLVNNYYPQNAQHILSSYLFSHNLNQAEKMVAAVDLHLKSNSSYNLELQQYENKKSSQDRAQNQLNVFDWMNNSQWADFKIAVAKDKQLIDSVACLTRVEPRLIVSVLAGEQIRLYCSNREAYKRWISPLKVLAVESIYSLGVTGIKVATARTIEQNLKIRTSVFYLGEKYEHLLDFRSTDIDNERFKRLTYFKNHYYSYLYAALNIKQIKMQWERAGFPIDERPEILATLYNVGFEASIPKANPVVGGSTVIIHEKPYSFGALAFEYYYSGELFDLFPFKPSKFDWRNGNL